MTIITDNIRAGTNNGMTSTINAYYTIPGGVIPLLGDPSDTVIAQTGSDIGWDSLTNTFYMAKCVAGGSTWIELAEVAG